MDTEPISITVEALSGVNVLNFLNPKGKKQRVAIYGPRASDGEG